MGGGFIELERQGIQNTFLIGNPQITFFKIVYKRFTNFAKECIEEKFNKTIKSNELLSHNLTKTGDLVQEIYFNIKHNLNQLQIILFMVNMILQI